MNLLQKFCLLPPHQNRFDFPNPQDSSGHIENEELSGFLKDLLELVKTVFDTLNSFNI